MLAALPTAGQADRAQPRHVGGVNTGLPPTTAGPDLRSVAIVAGNDLTDDLGERARFCFDSNIATLAGGWVLMSYDARRWWSGTASRATDDERCAIVTFAKGADIAQATVGQVGPGAVKDVAGKPNIVASEPVGGSVATPVAGRTTGPDLIDVTVDTTDAGHKRVTYKFDESLNPSPTRPDGPDADDPAQPESAYQRQDFAYALQDGDPVSAPVGNVNASGDSVTIDFGSAPVENAVRFITNPNAVEDRPASAVQQGSGLSLVTPSSPGVVVKNPQTGGRPDLVKAEPAGANTWKLTYNMGVTDAAPGKFQAIADDGTVSAVASSTGYGGAQESVLITFPDSEALTKDPGSIVRILSASGAVKNATDTDKTSMYAQAVTNTANNTPGITNGPDLLGVGVDPATQRTAFIYDEPVANGSSASNVFGFRSDGTSGAGSGGVSTTGNSVVVTMGAGIGDYVAYGAGYGAVTDPAGRPSPNQSVSKDNQVAASQTPTPAPAPAPAPTTSKRKRYTTGFAIAHRRGKTYSGRITSGLKSCKSTRTVIIRKVSKGGAVRYGTAKTRKDGTFKIRRSRLLHAKVYISVVERKTSKYVCGSRKSKSFRG